MIWKSLQKAEEITYAFMLFFFYSHKNKALITTTTTTISTTINQNLWIFCAILFKTLSQTKANLTHNSLSDSSTLKLNKS